MSSSRVIISSAPLASSPIVAQTASFDAYELFLKLSEIMSWEQDLAFDRQHLWHPYTSMVDPLPCYPVRSAEGEHIFLADGKILVDGMSSWWAAVHGYNHPKLNAALEAQIKDMSHVMFGGITHQPAIKLGRELLSITPDDLQHVFFADSGSVAVEVAIKMAMQYWFAQGEKQKSKLLTIMGGYHGDTLACMSVCDPVSGMHEMFNDLLPKQIFAPMPSSRFEDEFDTESVSALESILEERHEEIAAFILEPIVQGAGGMRFYSPSYLKAARELCDKYEVLIILDEIATGFGRSGKLFACEHSDIQPDIMCLGKAITGGYLTLAATLTSEKVAKGISSGANNPLMHGPTFMANPLACSAAIASLELLKENEALKQVSNIEEKLKSHLFKAQELDHVADVRVLGAIGVIELTQAVDMAKIQQAFVSEGVWLRPFGKLVYMMPPYVISEEALNKLLSVTLKIVSDKNLIF